MHGENIHKNHPYCCYPSMPTHPHQIMPPYHYHNIPPYPYPIIPPNQVCLCTYCTSTSTCSPFLVPHYPHIPPLGYLHTSSSRIPSSVLPLHSKKRLMDTEGIGGIEDPTNRRIAENIKLIRTLFPCLFMDHMKIWYVTKVFFC